MTTMSSSSPAWVLQAVLGVATFDQQPALAGGRRKRGELEADDHSPPG